MTVRIVKRSGKRGLVLDIMYRSPDGSRGRFRRDAEVQMLAAARAEERRRLALLVSTGSPTCVGEHPREERSPEPRRLPTLEEVAAEYPRTFAPPRLKPSTIAQGRSAGSNGATSISRADSWSFARAGAEGGLRPRSLGMSGSCRSRHSSRPLSRVHACAIAMLVSLERSKGPPDCDRSARRRGRGNGGRMGLRVSMDPYGARRDSFVLTLSYASHAPVAQLDRAAAV